MSEEMICPECNGFGDNANGVSCSCKNGITSFPKSKRTTNLDLIQTIRKMPCTVCSQRPSDAHHVSTRGSGGGDTITNLIPLCRDHHIQWHQLGANQMSQQFASVLFWIKDHGREDLLRKAK